MKTLRIRNPTENGFYPSRYYAKKFAEPGETIIIKTGEGYRAITPEAYNKIVKRGTIYVFDE